MSGDEHIPATRPSPPRFTGHLARIALLCCALLAGAFVGALFTAFVEGAQGPFGVALGRADDISEPLLVVAALACGFATLRASLGEGMARRRRLVALRRRVRRWGWTVHLLWLPIILVVVFAEGPVLLLTLATPVIVIAFVWMGALLSSRALQAKSLTWAVAATLGLVIGLFA